MDNKPHLRPENRAENETLLDRDIAAALRASVVEPSVDFTDMLMAEIEPAPAIIPKTISGYGRLPVYLIGLSLALVLVMFLLPSSESPAAESAIFSTSLLWTCCAIGLIAILGLTQTRRFTHILPR